MTCIACSKQQLADAGEDTARGTPRNKEAVKSLTSQIKDMVLKFSGVYRQCKPGGGPSSSTSYRKGHHHRSYVGDYDDASEAGGGGGRGDYYPYLIGKGGSSSSTPAWDFTRVNTPAGASDAKKMSRCEAWIPGVGISGVETLVGGCCDPPTMTEDDEEPKEWVAQVEPGVHITFLALPQGGNDLKRIRFSREMFNKWQAQRWWGENYDRIMELYNVQRFSRQALATPPRSEDERESSYSRVGSTRESPVIQSSLDKGKDRSPLHAYNSNTTNTNERTLTASSSSGAAGRGVYFPAPAPDPTEHFFPQYHNQQLGSGGNFGKGEASSIDASRTTTSSRDEASVSISNASDIEATEWVEQDEPGVYITIRQLADGTRELRRVRFSRERFGEVHAKLWWEENRERIHAQYL